MKARIEIRMFFGDWCYFYRPCGEADFHFIGEVRNYPIPWDDLFFAVTGEMTQEPKPVVHWTI